MKLKSDFRKEISYYKKLEKTLEKNLIKEEKKSEDNLSLIEKYIINNKDLDVEQLVESIIFKGWITKGNLTKQQLYLSTKDLVIDFLVIEDSM